jgi:hypothetical protein
MVVCLIHEADLFLELADCCVQAGKDVDQPQCTIELFDDVSFSVRGSDILG